MNNGHTLIKNSTLQLFFAIILGVCSLSAQDTLITSQSAPLKVVQPTVLPISDEDPELAKSADQIKFSETKNMLFECRMKSFSASDYNKAVKAIFKDFEEKVGKKIIRGAKGRVGLKIYSNSGKGIATPQDLVDAVIIQLENRGYKKDEIVLVDLNRFKLREVGFLPRVSQMQAGVPDNYKGTPVADLMSEKYYDKKWFYDSPLAPKVTGYDQPDYNVYDPELRKSMIPVPLYYTFDFWINLPVITENKGIGVSGAIANVSLWNVSNHDRFLEASANSPMAMAEISAIPEMREAYLFSILSFEKMQIAGGNIFNSGVTVSEPYLLLSSDIVLLDYIAWDLMNKHRTAKGFERITLPMVLENCTKLNLGNVDMSKHDRIFVSYK